MTYPEAVAYLLALGRELAAPQQARVQKFGLENITILARLLGDPQNAKPCVHIAGTNGKGSTAAMLDSILRAAGLRTGLYTSPHLVRINERIRLNGEEISDQAFAESCTRVVAAAERGMATGELAAHPTYFECVTAMAFDCFARAPLDFAIYEVGLGGRLDATNIVAPEVCVITQIDFDHEDYLGHTIEEIAAEKAGIIKPGVPVVSAAENPAARMVIARACQQRGARLVEVDSAYRILPERESPFPPVEGVPERLPQPEPGSVREPENDGHAQATVVSAITGATLTIAPALRGQFQLRNALAAAAAAELLAQRGFSISPSAIERGIATTQWPGRLEKLMERPDVYLDGAHNPAAARELLRFWQREFAGRRIFLVYGAMRDKAVDEIAGLLFPHADRVWLTAPHQPRAISAPLLAEIAGHHARDYRVLPDPAAALEDAIREAAPAADLPEAAVFATGSLYLVGELRRYWLTRAVNESPTPTGG
jgi:dihydrofolate synthase/folylpolyglutamate synthase